MFVIAGVSGHTGSVVASTLLDAGKKVRVIVRDEAKGKAWKDRGAEVAVANVDDVNALTKALTGATGAYLLLPPAPTEPHVVARGRRVIDTIAAALETTKVPHLVFLSSIGAQHADGNGPVKMLHYGEQKLGALANTKLTSIRAAYFMENIGNMLHPMKTNGVLPVFGGGESHKFPMIATKDIGTVAAHALLEAPSTNQVIELSAAEDYSMADAAAAFSKALGKTVTATAVPIDGVVPAFTQSGMGEDMAKLYREMLEGMGKGLMSFEGGSARSVRGKLTMTDVVGALTST